MRKLTGTKHFYGKYIKEFKHLGIVLSDLHGLKTLHALLEDHLLIHMHVLIF